MSGIPRKNCLYLARGKWYDYKCIQEKSFICEVPSAIEIKNDTRLVFSSENITVPAIQIIWESKPFGKARLTVEQQRDWKDAEANCASKGGHLASASFPHVWETVFSHIKAKELEGSSFWLGGTNDRENWTLA